jgi:guanylate kinase
MSNEAITGYRRGIGGGLAFVVSGPSGAGKNSVIDRVMELLPGLSYSVSYTTRPPRPHEVPGRDYHFVSREEFERLIAAGELVEHVQYLGDYYGTGFRQIEEVFAQGKDVILNIDVNGARTLRARGLLRFTVIYVFLAPSSLSRLEERLRVRGTEDEAEIARRLEVAARELEEIPGFDYLVINDEFDRAVDELAGIITAERVRIVCR